MLDVDLFCLENYFNLNQVQWRNYYFVIHHECLYTRIMTGYDKVTILIMALVLYKNNLNPELQGYNTCYCFLDGRSEGSDVLSLSNEIRSANYGYCSTKRL